MRKSTSRASRCRMERICTAPSAGPDFGAGMVVIGTTFEYPNACAMSAGRLPPNRIEKKLRNAREMRFKLSSKWRVYKRVQPLPYGRGSVSSINDQRRNSAATVRERLFQRYPNYEFMPNPAT